MRLYPLILGVLVAVSSWAITPEENRALICSIHKELNLEECSNDPPIANPPVTNWTWVELPETSMNSVHVELDERYDFPGGAYNSWNAIQSAWSGATVINRNNEDRLYVTGGGHGDGAHNGILSVNSLGEWSRITEPSAIWRPVDCPNNICASDFGDCVLDSCTTMPDSTPGATHTYNGVFDVSGMFCKSGGSWWKTNTGTGPKNWCYDFDSKSWSSFEDFEREKPHQNVVTVGNISYLMNSRGVQTLDHATMQWTRQKPPNARSYSGNTTMRYDELTDRFYVFGSKASAWTMRDTLGGNWTPILDAPELLDDIGVGVIQIGRQFIMWSGGSNLSTYHIDNNTWGSIEADGDPGPESGRGTWGRFAILDGFITLVNGTFNNIFRLVPPGTVVDPNQPPIIDPNQPPIIDPNEPPVIEPPVGDLPDFGGPILENPYYDTAPTWLMNKACGPIEDWTQISIHNDLDMAAANAIKDKLGMRLAFNIFPHEEGKVYSGLSAKKASCMAVIGHSDSEGNKPKTNKINFNTPPQGTSQGGLYIENIHVSLYDYGDQQGGVYTGGDCVVAPRNRQFVIFKDTNMSGCSHHSFITTSNQPYVEIDGGTFEHADSHNAYIQGAYVWVHGDALFQSPGWGHSLRVIARKYLIEDVKVSNIEFDGSISTRHSEEDEDGVKQRIGMHPLDIYNCTKDSIVRNVQIRFYGKPDKNGFMSSNYRIRDALEGCDISGVDPGADEWRVTPYDSEEYWDELKWDDREVRIENVNLICDGERDGCNFITTSGSRQIPWDRFRESFTVWFRKWQFNTWEEARSKLVETPILVLPEDEEWHDKHIVYPTTQYVYVFDRVLPNQRPGVLDRGTFTSKWPLPMNPTQPLNYATVYLKNINVTNTSGEPLWPLVRETKPTSFFCWDELIGEQCKSTRFPESKVMLWDNSISQYKTIRDGF